MEIPIIDSDKQILPFENQDINQVKSLLDAMLSSKKKDNFTFLKFFAGTFINMHLSNALMKWLEQRYSSEKTAANIYKEVEFLAKVLRSEAAIDNDIALYRIEAGERILNEFFNDFILQPDIDTESMGIVSRFVSYTSEFIHYSDEVKNDWSIKLSSGIAQY